MGHNFSLEHDSTGNICPATGFIMNAVTILNNAPTAFSDCSLTDLSEYLANHSLAYLATQPGTIFDSGFE